jgi:hypothetical protein
MADRDHLYREHGRLVKRFKRQQRSFELAKRLQTTPGGRHRARQRATRIVGTVTELMMVERMMLLSDLEFAALQRDPERLGDFVAAPSKPEIIQRIRLMAPGAGLELPS